MVLLHRQHFLTGAIDALYGALSNSSYQFVLCITIGFGGMITLFQESGALMGFRDLLLAVGAFPKAGVLKRAYRRVESDGPAFERDEKAEKLVDVADVDESRASSAWNAVGPLAFLLVGATVFAVGGCWVVMTIAIPVFVPLALSMGVTAPVIIAAVMSGIGLGYSTCFYADAVFMTTAGTGVSNITIIKATLPYAAGAAAVYAPALSLSGTSPRAASGCALSPFTSSSSVTPKSSESFRSFSSSGTDTSVSHLETLWREISSASARSPCDQFLCVRRRTMFSPSVM